MRTLLTQLSWLLFSLTACQGVDTGAIDDTDQDLSGEDGGTDEGGDDEDTGPFDTGEEGGGDDGGDGGGDDGGDGGSDGVDADGDGHFSIDSGGDDCDDDDPESTLQGEDQDCDGTETEDDCDDTDPALNRADRDGDGSSVCDGDCDDENARVHPDAIDGFFIDWNCDGELDPATTLGGAEVQFNGESEGNAAGYSVSSAGDVDGDGLDDILVGAPYDEDVGSRISGAYIILASSLGASTSIDLADADYKLIGENTNDYSGLSVASAGDVDGDGLDDVLVGTPFDPQSSSLTGSVYVVLGASLGSTRHIDLATADYKLNSEYAATYAGWSVAGAGDVDGDGLDDILVGAPRTLAWTGSAYLVLGSSLGSTSQIDLGDADYKFRGEETGDYAGISVASAGDVDGDGLSDILVGACANNEGDFNAGSAYVILAASLGSSQEINLSRADYKMLGEEDSDAAGVSVASAGDVDGDGLDDILVGSYFDGTFSGWAGGAYVVTMATLATSSTLPLSMADHKLRGEGILDYAGTGIASLGDLDGDGLSDILVGAYSNNEGGTESGTTYLFLADSLSGRIKELTSADLLILGEGENDHAGRSVSSAGDVNGDGLEDILVGAPADSDGGGGTRSGSAYLILTGR